MSNGKSKVENRGKTFLKGEKMSGIDTPEHSGYDVSIIRPEMNAADVQNRGKGMEAGRLIIVY